MVRLCGKLRQDCKVLSPCSITYLSPRTGTLHVGAESDHHLIEARLFP